MSDTIEYGNLMHAAMRGLIQTVLRDVQENGLPGEHHFLISFDTRHRDVELADWLRERFPEDMLIVMQHWFDQLEVGDDGFSVVLNFGDSPERLYIPFDAIRTFVDPSVEFGLRFETQEDAETDETAEAPAEPEPEAEAPAEAPAQKDADVVSLDSFRK